MTNIHAGADTYGRVKSVAGTPIVTKFAMLQFFPLDPLQSFYMHGCWSLTIGWHSIMVMTEERLDPFAMIATLGLLMLLVTGIVGGLLTYLISLTSPRERQIREYRAGAKRPKTSFSAALSRGEKMRFSAVSDVDGGGLHKPDAQAKGNRFSRYSFVCASDFDAICKTCFEKMFNET